MMNRPCLDMEIRFCSKFSLFDIFILLSWLSFCDAERIFYALSYIWTWNEVIKNAKCSWQLPFEFSTRGPWSMFIIWKTYLIYVTWMGLNLQWTNLAKYFVFDLEGNQGSFNIPQPARKEYKKFCIIKHFGRSWPEICSDVYVSLCAKKEITLGFGFSDRRERIQKLWLLNNRNLRVWTNWWR